MVGWFGRFGRLIKLLDRHGGLGWQDWLGTREGTVGKVAWVDYLV